MQHLADALDRLRYFPKVAEDLVALREEMDVFLQDAPFATLVRTWSAGGLPVGEYLPLSLMPILRGSPISVGHAVGWHGVSPSLAQRDNLEIGYDGRLLAGRLVHAAKQYENPRWAIDSEGVHRIGMLATWALGTARSSWEPDLIVAMPSSRGTNDLPALIARDIGFLTRIPVAPPSAVRFTRSVGQVKEVRDYWEKLAMLADAMEADPSVVEHRNVLIVDDVCRSGVTLRECAEACDWAGSASVGVLAISKTWRFQQLPDTYGRADLRMMRASTAIEPYDAL